MFFISGAFWTGVTLAFEHSNELKAYLMQFIICVLACIFGGVLLWISRKHFKMRDEKIRSYFKKSASS